MAAESIQAIHKLLHATFRSGKTIPLSWRTEQLQALIRGLREGKEELSVAIRKDLRQNDFVTETEIAGPEKEAEIAIKQLPNWVLPEKKTIPLLQQPGHGYVQSDPLGVVLIISPWNYPISLLLKPLIGAVAAGNAVLLKPSEVSANCSKALANLVNKYLDKSAIRLIEGGVKETTEILKLKWDHILYTGSGAIGKVVMRAASEHLTPVTLELGGKSPAIIDKDVNLNVAAKRIVWAKFMNAGQTCVAPDYILVTKETEKALLERLQATIQEFYGKDPQSSADFSRIINENHTKRIQKLLQGTIAVCGGHVDLQDKYIAPTILTNVNPNSPVMQEEIFGPVLPVIAVDTIDDAIDFVNSRDKPLALYVFSENKQTQDKIVKNTSSGGVSVNDAIMHLACPELPFGGVGPSGMGAYNGKHTFDTFSHKKSVLNKGTWTDSNLRYPPYTPSKLRWLKRLNALTLPSKATLIALLAVPLSIIIYRYAIARL